MKKSIIAALALTMAMALTACGGSKVSYTDGTYTGTGTGIGGEVKVEVTVADSKISKVEVLEHSETEGISDPAIKDVPAAIISKQSADVDSVSGATVTSEAIKTAVKAALTEATAK